MNNCWYCAQLIADGEDACGVDNCRRLQQQCAREAQKIHNRDRLLGIWNACRQRCRYDDDWDIRGRWWLCWYYTFKAIVCVLLDLRGNVYCSYGEDAVEGVDSIAIWNVHALGGEYGGEGWTVLAVGRGFFGGWQYEISQDTSV